MQKAIITENITRKHGFSLIELIMVIVIMSIIAVVAAPRFFSKSSFDGYILRDLFISQLRQTQMMAISNTDYCYRVNVSNSNYTVNTYSGISSTSGFCDSNKQVSSTTYSYPDDTFRLVYKVETNIVSNVMIEFDNNGAITTPPFNCQQDTANDSLCITITGGSDIKIIISKEGYIYGG